MFSSLSIKELDPWALPAVPLMGERQLPSAPGITFVIRKRAVLHVGVSANLLAHWIKHPLWESLKKLSPDAQIHFLECSGGGLHYLLSLASGFIDTYSPQFNAVKPALEAAKSLQALEFIQDELQELEAQPYLIDCYVQRTAAGGTAAGRGRDPGRYACLRSRYQTFVNGKKSQYIPLYAIAKYEEQCERGRRIKRLRKSRDKIRDRLEQVRQTLERTGIELPTWGD